MPERAVEKSTEEKVLCLLKEDSFGRVELVEKAGVRQVRRTACGGRIPGSGLLGRFLARREMGVLQRLGGVPGVPRFLGQVGRDRFYRSYVEGCQLDEVETAESRYFEELFSLLDLVHAAGVVHNDLAKEANILVTSTRRPALVDFQLALAFPPGMGALRRRFFDLLCREDRRHLLKQKALHRPDLLTPEEWRALRRKSLPARLWSATAMKLYHALTRPLGWRDREGRGKNSNQRRT